MEHFGALIERGVITEKTANGYRIRSLTREGLNTPPLPALDGREYAAGELVYFFLFDDGNGAVLARFN